MARNKYPGPCKDCGDTVNIGDGYFEKIPGTRRWHLRHVLCVAVAKSVEGRELSQAQRAALAQVEARS